MYKENVNLKNRVSPDAYHTLADPTQSADSAQVRVTTIALHTKHEKTRNIQEAHVSQRRIFS